MDRVLQEQIARILSFDVSPMRPHEFADVPLYEQIEAEDFRRAWNKGVSDAQDEHDARERAGRSD